MFSPAHIYNKKESKVKLPKVDLFNKKNWIGIAVLIVILFAVMQSCSGKKEPAKPESSSESSETVTAPAVPESSATAERPPAEPAAPSVPTVPVTPVAIHVPPSVQELISALGDKNGAVAKEAAVRLINLAAVAELTDAFVLGDSKMKERVLWCLRQMNEPVRVFFSEVRSKPMEFHPRVKVAVEEITMALSGSFYQPATSQPPADQSLTDETEKKILLLQLENQLKDKRRELQGLRAKMLQAARAAHTTWVSPGYYWSRQARSLAIQRQYAAECISLKANIAEAEGVISLLSDEINNLREEIEILSM